MSNFRIVQHGEQRVDAQRGDGSNGTLRYARWPTFDKIGDVREGACWLDRKTGRLVYQASDSDPNRLAVNPAPNDGVEVW
jgi:hypothetical protein